MHYRQLLPFLLSGFLLLSPSILLLKKFFVIQTMNPTGNAYTNN